MYPLKGLPPLPQSPEERDKKINNGSITQKPLTWQKEWYQKVGVYIFEKSLWNHFSVKGAIIIIAQAYREQATTESGRKNGYTHNNWWNFSALRNKKQVTKPGYKFASFETLKEGFDAYINRITSKENLVAYPPNNATFNPSYPKFGSLLKQDAWPTSIQINDALRIGGIFVFCADEPQYGSDIIKLRKIVIEDFTLYLKDRIKSLPSTSVEYSKLSIYLRRLNYEYEKL